MLVIVPEDEKNKMGLIKKIWRNKGCKVPKFEKILNLQIQEAQEKYSEHQTYTHNRKAA